MKMFKQAALFLFLIALLPGAMLMAQESLKADESKGTELNSVVENGAVKTPTVLAQSVEPGMSPAEIPAEIVDKSLSTADDLVRQTINTTMVAGSCLVIDQFVRQFCAGNPSDISCQYQ